VVVARDALGRSSASRAPRASSSRLRDGAVLRVGLARAAEAMEAGAIWVDAAAVANL